MIYEWSFFGKPVFTTLFIADMNSTATIFDLGNNKS